MAHNNNNTQATLIPINSKGILISRVQPGITLSENLTYTMAPTANRPQLIINTNKGITNIYTTFSQKLDILCTNVINIAENKFKILLSSTQMENALMDENLNILEKNGISVTTNDNHKLNRTIILKKLDKYITDYSDEDIMQHIGNLNKVKITKVIRIPEKDYILKVQCETPDEAELLYKNGIKFPYTFCPPQHIKKHILPNTPIICTKCYTINHHITAVCKDTRLICSKCSGIGHRHFNCTNQNPHCLNCGGKHCCLSPSCPHMKYVMNKVNSAQQQLSEHLRPERQAQIQPQRRTLLPTPPIPSLFDIPINNTTHAFPPLNSHMSSSTQNAPMNTAHSSPLRYADVTNPTLHTNTVRHELNQPPNKRPHPVPDDNTAKYGAAVDIAAKIANPSINLDEFNTVLNDLLRSNNLPAFIISPNLIQTYTRKRNTNNINSTDIIQSNIVRVPVPLVTEEVVEQLKDNSHVESTEETLPTCTHEAQYTDIDPVPPIRYANDNYVKVMEELFGEHSRSESIHTLSDRSPSQSFSPTPSHSTFSTSPALSENSLGKAPHTLVNSPSNSPPPSRKHTPPPKEQRLKNTHSKQKPNTRSTYKQT